MLGGENCFGRNALGDNREFVAVDQHFDTGLVGLDAQRRGARGKRAARRRLIGVVTVSALRNLFRSILISIDPGPLFSFRFV